jgi:hypothetical protein
LQLSQQQRRPRQQMLPRWPQSRWSSLPQPFQRPRRRLQSQWRRQHRHQLSKFDF